MHRQAGITLYSCGSEYLKKKKQKSESRKYQNEEELQGNSEGLVLGSVLFLAYVNGIPNERDVFLFADIKLMRIKANEDMERYKLIWIHCRIGQICDCLNSTPANARL